MPIYKKYHSGAAIDGAKASFPLYDIPSPAKSAQIERFYPDEWLIANTLQKYLKLLKLDPQQILVLPEPWAGNGYPGRGNTTTPRTGGEKEGSDEGYSNSPGFNSTIINVIANGNANRLILVPYLYFFHHPGIAIQQDAKNHTGIAVYIDPTGSPPRKKEVKELEDYLRSEKNMDVQQVKTQQQYDGLICGFVLTGSMMKFIEEFLQTGKISVNGFKSPKPFMNTVYMFQMYVNNWQFNDREPSLIDEVMLAEQDLWKDFIEEQNLPQKEKIIAAITAAIAEQERYLDATIPRGVDKQDLNILKLDFIRDFQQKLIEMVFMRNMHQLIKLNELNHLLLNSRTTFEFQELYQAAKPYLELNNLLSEKQLENTKRLIGIQPPIQKSLSYFFNYAAIFVNDDKSMSQEHTVVNRK